MKPSLFIIGGNGFVGRNFIQLMHTDYRITVFDKYIDQSFFEKYHDVETYNIDLSSTLIPLEYSTPDYIINLASIVTARRDLNLFDAMIQTNLKILLNLYERFKDNPKLKLFIQFGSSEEYGNLSIPFREDMREYPNSPYALVKQLTTNTALMLHRNYGFPTCVVRPGNLYGNFQPKDKFIPYIEEKLKANENIEVTLCEQKRDFIHIDKFIEYINQIIKCHKKVIGEIINISSGQSVSLQSIIEEKKKAIGSTSEIHYGAIPYREGEAMNLTCDITKLISIIKTSDK